ncbi:hypothetical protein LOK49_LG10G01882 [Camellia lanceoleosa]|uniref:Uncharacterized protein n=1 Tax=Camellia lanceoleosa TaxID=1840588 RepID=A0ACC0GDE6_9ERIC|nr:hypothetical protein LOK49_LG10G01882 [Camellia lanceoleosa]
MECVAKVHHRCQPLHRSLHHHRPLFSIPISSLSFKTPPPPSSSSLKSSLSIIASSSSSASFSNPNLQNPKPQLTPNLFPFSFLKATAIAAVAAATLLFTRFNLKPLISFSAISPLVTFAAEGSLFLRRERANPRRVREFSYERCSSPPELNGSEDQESKGRQSNRHCQTIDWTRTRRCRVAIVESLFASFDGDLKMVKLGFNEILKKDPCHVEVYHGLVMTMLEANSEFQLKEIKKRLVEPMERSKREKKMDDLRD